MITEDKYLEAKKVVDEYQKQLADAEELRSIALDKKRIANEKWCEDNGGHEYYSSGGKWSSVSQMSCYHCGKTINK